MEITVTEDHGLGDAFTAIDAPPDLSSPIDFVTSPFVVLRDSREKAPWGFHGLSCDSQQKNKLIVVRTEYEHLPTGDYSMNVARGRVAVERKSLEDLFTTLGQHRERFERELERLNAMEFAAVIAEADWNTILLRPPARSRLNPKTIFRSVLAWQQRFSNVHWHFMGSRRLAEVTCYRVLERFYKDRVLTGEGEPKP